jgi:release factor glutamine methyltransferase
MQVSNPTTSPQTSSWTILSLLEWATGYLSARHFDESRLCAELLLAHVLHVRRLDLYLQFDRPLSSSDLAAFKSLFQRRLTHEPLQYIIGETEFMGLPLWVNPSVLIPRPETELLAEKAVEELKSRFAGAGRILDIGTGSGNIAIAVGHFVPGAKILAVDVSDEALETASRNIARHELKNVELRAYDIYEDTLPEQEFDLIVSNPPYVSVQEYSSLQPEVRDFEPRIATSDEGDGLRFMRRILEFAAGRLVPGGIILLEIGFGQSEATREIAAAAGFGSIDIIRDYSGIPRVLRAERPPAEVQA